LAASTQTHANKQKEVFEMKIRNLIIAIALGASSVPFAAMAQANDAADTIVVTAEHQRDWDRGNRLEARGIEDLAKAQRELVRRSADVVNFQNRRDTSMARAENAQRTFDNLVANPSVADAKDAREWAKRLEEVASEWESNAERMEEADRDLERALRRKTNAETEVVEAQSKIDEGRAQMAQAERASRLVATR